MVKARGNATIENLSTASGWNLARHPEGGGGDPERIWNQNQNSYKNKDVKHV